MKKIFIFVLLLLLVPAICLAEPQVTSDKQTFNPGIVFIIKAD